MSPFIVSAIGIGFIFSGTAVNLVAALTEMVTGIDADRRGALLSLILIAVGFGIMLVAHR